MEDLLSTYQDSVLYTVLLFLNSKGHSKMTAVSRSFLAMSPFRTPTTLRLAPFNLPLRIPLTLKLSGVLTAPPIQGCGDLRVVGGEIVNINSLITWAPKLSIGSLRLEQLPPRLNHSLTYLDIKGTKVKNLAPLKYCTNLEELGLNHINGIRSLEPLTHLTKLRKLGLAYISLANNRDIDLRRLPTSLEELSLCAWVFPSGRVFLKSLAPLKQLKKLAVLMLGGARVREDTFDLSHLPPSIRILRIQSTAVRSVRPLLQLENLERVNITGCFDITDSRLLEGRKNLVVEGLAISARNLLRGRQERLVATIPIT